MHIPTGTYRLFAAASMKTTPEPSYGRRTVTVRHPRPRRLPSLPPPMSLRRRIRGSTVEFRGRGRSTSWNSTMTERGRGNPPDESVLYSDRDPNRACIQPSSKDCATARCTAFRSSREMRGVSRACAVIPSISSRTVPLGLPAIRTSFSTEAERALPRVTTEYVPLPP
jgi:hypothetical protein